MPRRYRFTWSMLLAGVAPALVLLIEIVRLNPRLSWRDVPPIAAALWMISVALTGLPVGALALLLRMGRFRFRPGDYYRLAGVWLFAWLWLARLEPAHQPISIRPHLSAWGAVELGLVCASSIVIFGLWRGRFFSRASRWAVVPLAFVVASACLFALAWSVEPSRRRDVPVAEIARRYPPHTQEVTPRPRVLVIGIDGLEWRTIDWMTAHGRMPTVAGLLRTGRRRPAPHRPFLSAR